MKRGSPRPVAPGARIVEVDIVRGFALFGVLLVNMYGFGADSIAWDGTIDRLAFAFTRFFFESKSWTLFSMLFGVGFAIQLERAETLGVGVSSTFVRRLIVLFVIGAAHALFYDGDILMLYAELGVGLLVVRRWPTRLLSVMAVALVLVFPLVRFATSFDEDAEREEPLTVAEARSELELDRATHVYSTGSLPEVALDNSNAIPADPLEDVGTPESGLAVFAMFLVGLVVGRSGALREISSRVEAIARVRAWGLGLGFAAMAGERMLATTRGYAVYGPQSAAPGAQLAGDLLFAAGTVALALGYAATIVLAVRSPFGHRLLAPLAAVGRLALTVYLTQTLIFTSLFYGYGLGWAFRVGPAAVTALAAAIFALQVLGCAWWTKRFRFGPAEWLWRSATYLQWQPLRHAAEAPASTVPER